MKERASSGTRVRIRPALKSAAAIVFGASAAVALMAAPVTSTAANASEGVTDSEIVIGSTCPKTGPITQFATSCAVSEMVFDSINAQGGLKMKDGKTRKIRFIWYDDAYSPQKSVEQVRRLVERDGIFALKAPIGTPTNLAVRPYLNERGVPQVLVGSGSTLWGAELKKYPWTIGWQPNYAGEANIFVEFLKTEHPEVKTVAALYQNDDFGQDYLGAFMRAAAAAGISVTGIAGYETTDTSIQAQIIKLAATKADALFIAATPGFAAQAIKTVHTSGWRPLRLIPSISNSTANMLAAGREAAEGTYTAAFSLDPLNPAVKDSADMKRLEAMYQKFKPEFLNMKDALTMSGWASTEVFVKALAEMPEMTRESFMKTLLSLKQLEVPGLLPGIRTTYNGVEDPFGIESAWIQQFRSGEWHAVGKEPITKFEGSRPEPGIEYFKSHRP